MPPTTREYVLAMQRLTATLSTFVRGRICAYADEMSFWLDNVVMPALLVAQLTASSA